MLKYLILLSLITIHFNVYSETNSVLFNQALTGLTSSNFNDKADALDQLVLSKSDDTLFLLDNLEQGKLYYRKIDKRIVVIKKIERKYEITDLITKQILGVVKKRKIKKIGINNKLRSKIRSLKSVIYLNSNDADQRYQAVQNILETLDPVAISQLEQKISHEKEAKVKALMQIVIAISQLNTPDKILKLQAIQSLQGRLEPIVLVKLKEIIDIEQDAEIIAASQKSIASIQLKLKLSSYAETLFFGLSLGSVLVLAAIGLAITFGVMGVINMAHGELIMLGAYTTYVIQQIMPNHIALTLFLAIPAAFMVAGLVGIMIERGIIRHLYGRPLETLLATFGISLILQQMVRSIFSPLNRSVITPDWMSGSIVINSALSITINRLVIIIFCLMVFAMLYLILKKTRLGLQVRAVSQNRPMARAMGVKSDWVDAMTFGLGSGVAGVAGVALSQLTNVGPNLGQAYIIDSFMVVVFGGVGNLWGTLVGGLGLGVANKLLEPWSGAVLAKILILVFIILFIQKRPRGLFPQKGRAVEN